MMAAMTYTTKKARACWGTPNAAQATAPVPAKPTKNLFLLPAMSARLPSTGMSSAKISEATVSA